MKKKGKKEEELVKKYKKLYKEYIGLKEQAKEYVIDERDAWRICIKYKPLLPGHIVVQAIHTEEENKGKPIEVRGGLADKKVNKGKLGEIFKGVIAGIMLLRKEINPERIYLSCFSDSGDLHFHLYPILPNQKAVEGHALDWLASHERRVDSIPELDRDISENNLIDLKQLICDLEGTFDTLNNKKR